MAYDYIRRGKAEENGYTNTKVLRCSVLAVQVIMIMLHEKKTEVESWQLKEEMKVT